MQGRIKSFVRRAGRMTPGQQGALRRLWPRFGIDNDDLPLDFDNLFGRRAERVLEIGFGNGETLLEQAAQNPGQDFVGIEVHPPGIGHCLLGIECRELDNLRLLQDDAVEVLRQRIADQTLARINLYFPDPWPKKRHHKRRLVQPTFLALAARKLTPDGSLCIATDWADYARHIDEALAHCPVLQVIDSCEHRGDRPLDRPLTKFEQRGLRLGHRIKDWRVART